MGEERKKEEEERRARRATVISAVMSDGLNAMLVRGSAPKKTKKTKKSFD